MIRVTTWNVHCNVYSDCYTISKTDTFYLLTIVTLSCFSSAKDRTESNQFSWSLPNPPLNIVNRSRRPPLSETRMRIMFVYLVSEWWLWCNKISETMSTWAEQYRFVPWSFTFFNLFLNVQAVVFVLIWK